MRSLDGCVAESRDRGGRDDEGCLSVHAAGVNQRDRVSEPTIAILAAAAGLFVPIRRHRHSL